MEDQNLVTSLYPPPPPYVKFFTRENIEKLEKYRKEANGEELNLKEEDKHLEFLIPPKQPDTETYRSFGNIWKFNDKIPKLEEMGIAQLYKEPESSASEDSNFRIQELKKLLKSLLLNFLEITGVMSVSPESFNTKVEHIRTILINIHHLLNEYRPHQSRESLILLLEKQVEIKKHDVKEIEHACKKVEDEIRELVNTYIDGKGTGNTRSTLVKSEEANDDIEMDNTEIIIKTEDSS